MTIELDNQLSEQTSEAIPRTYKKTHSIEEVRLISSNQSGQAVKKDALRQTKPQRLSDKVYEPTTYGK